MEPADPQQSSLTLEVAAVRWRAADDGFAVLAGVTDEGEEVVVTGALGHVHEGESVEVHGGWRRHAKHGWQFFAERALVREPTGEPALLGYLASVKHIGPRGAAWLLERHGPEAVLAAIDRDPAGALREVPGIGRARIGAATRSWQEHVERRALLLFLAEHGVPAAAAARVERALGPGALDMIRTDPYALTEVAGIGFATADAIARALGMAPDAPERLDAGVLHALREAEQDGHCHLPRPELRERARRLLGADAADHIDALAAAGRLVIEDDRVAHPRMDAVERALARKVRELAEAPPALRIRAPKPPAGGFVPTDTQWSVVELVLGHRLVILTGLPGTGKTATMRALVDLLRAEHRSVRLCAPTGKAARRLAETTGARATTIHRLLEYAPGAGFARNADDPITGCDVLIVDEASMLDVRLAAALMDAVGEDTHVLLVGDVDQLAPVGPGRVLDDLIDSGAVPTVRLTEVFRQAARSLIIRAAHAINRGEQPPTRAGEGDIRDFFLIERTAPSDVFEEVCEIAVRRLPAAYDLDPSQDVLVLSPMHRGPIGIDAFNAELRRRLNPDGAEIEGTRFRLGDRFVQRRNDHEHQLMNGETGVVVADDPKRERLTLRCDDGRVLLLPHAACGTLELGYCLSVHRAQGSQNRAVVMALAMAHAPMLTRNLVYTAVTRAQELAVVVGDRRALAMAVARPDAARRFTRLTALVAGSPP